MKPILILRIVLTSLLIVIVAGCGLRRNPLVNASAQEYLMSDFAKWIVIPPNAEDITTFGFFGFDTNYRYLKCSVDPSNIDIPSLIAKSLDSQPRKINDTLIVVNNAKTTLDGFNSVFLSIPKSTPGWWKVDFSQFDRKSFCAWQDNRNYGYGYIYMYDSAKKELRAFQWSQQWNTVEKTKKSLDDNNSKTKSNVKVE